MTNDPQPTSPPHTNGGHKRILVKGPAPFADALAAEEKKILYSRIILAVAHVITAFAMVPFVQPRIVDPANRWLVLDPLIGLLMYWPLSRVLIRATSSMIWGHLLSLIPTVSLVIIRLYGNQRDPTFGTQPNLSFGTMVFLGICSVTAYLLFRTPPRQ